MKGFVAFSHRIQSTAVSKQIPELAGLKAEFLQSKSLSSSTEVSKQIPELAGLKVRNLLSSIRISYSVSKQIPELAGLKEDY